MKTFPSKQWLAVTGALCIVYTTLARASFANIYQEFCRMTHLSSHDIYSANRATPWLWCLFAPLDGWRPQWKFPLPTRTISAIYTVYRTSRPTPGIWEPTNKALTLISARVKTELQIFSKHKVKYFPPGKTVVFDSGLFIFAVSL